MMMMMMLGWLQVCGGSLHPGVDRRKCIEESEKKNPMHDKWTRPGHYDHNPSHYDADNWSL